MVGGGSGTGRAVPENLRVIEVSGVPNPSSVGGPMLRASDSATELEFDVAPVSGGGKAIARFEMPRAVYLGAPNDEALSGHRYWGKGLQLYAFQEVINSDWIAELEQRNRVHPRHRADLYDAERHFIVTFQDATFECVANGFDIDHRRE